MTENVTSLLVQVAKLETKLDSIIDLQEKIIPVIKDHAERVQRLEDVPNLDHADRIRTLEHKHWWLTGIGSAITVLMMLFGPILSYFKGTH